MSAEVCVAYEHPCKRPHSDLKQYSEVQTTVEESNKNILNPQRCLDFCRIKDVLVSAPSHPSIWINVAHLNQIQTECAAILRFIINCRMAELSTSNSVAVSSRLYF